VTPRAAAAAGIAAGIALAAVVVCGGPVTLAVFLAACAAAALLAAWPPVDRPLARGRAILALLLLPAVLQFHAAGGRINGDGVSYYVYVRSMMKDADLDFTNEYAHYGLLERADLAVPTRTGLRRSIFAIGPGLVSIPFFAAGEAAARLASAVSTGVDLSGYGPHHVNAVALGSLLLGFGAVLLVHSLAGRHFAPPVALLAAATVFLATFLYWYMVQQPTMSHAPSAFGAALVVWWWDRHRHAGTRTLLLLGLLIGMAMCLRWQNALLALLPGFDLLRRARPAWTASLRGGLALAGGMLAGALPQMAAWKVLYGEWVLRYPPHGADFLRLDRPFVLETLFSSRHGLLWWTPVLWLGYLGLAPLLRARRALALPLLAPVALMTYVNMCSGDWWAGGSFSNRRFDSLLPLLALGIAASYETIAAWVARRPALVPVALALGAAVAQVAATEGMRARPRGPVAFADVAGAGAEAVAGAAGSPPSWPASWIFAARQDRPPGQYDRLVGRYLFYRQNNLQGRVDMGDDALLAEGWSAPAPRLGREARAIAGRRARVLAPLDVAEDIAIDVTAAADPAGDVRVLVNGAPFGAFTARPAWGVHRVTAPRTAWRRDLNDVVLETGPDRVWIAGLQFLRAGAADGLERGFEAR
jgi:hypothetical protein